MQFNPFGKFVIINIFVVAKQTYVLLVCIVFHIEYWCVRAREIEQIMIKIVLLSVITYNLK